MFDLSEMTRLVDLQARSYALLRWGGEGVGRTALNFGVRHEGVSAGDAAREWLARNAASLPKEMRVASEDLPAFGRLFASYLTTSFTLRPSPTMVRSSRTGCYCDFCARLEFANALLPRQPDKKAQGRSREMKHLYLSGLVHEQGAVLSPTDIATLMTDADLAHALSYATYGRELLRRSLFASQGEGVLVLWREIAWINGKPNKKFALSAEAIVAAEMAVVERF